MDNLKEIRNTAVNAVAYFCPYDYDNGGKEVFPDNPELQEALIKAQGSCAHLLSLLGR